MNVIIPAAGLGTRFAPMRLSIPKELLPLGGKPLIAHALDEAARAGFERAIVVVSPAKHQLREYLAKDRHPIPVEIVSQPRPTGIGDAVLRGWRDEPVGVLIPDDVVLETRHWRDLIGHHQQDGAAALCVRPVPIETTSRFGIAECDDGRITRLLEKPPPGTSSSNLAIFGRYVVTKAVVAGLRSVQQEEAEVELTYGFAAAINTPPGIGAVTFGGEIYDCGNPAEYSLSIGRFPLIDQFPG
jgi:UTP--glucose-1-phosphate uridylyltransferase